ncbi:MAG: hypothetical protein KGR26_05495, partial [Cyanobacteria bacterium REEB65]|nr:hypothetical protein [Cyanobacteria bacterium REEB65]
MDPVFEALAQRFRSGSWSVADNVLKATVQPPASRDIPSLPPRGTAERQQLEARGVAALHNGELGLVVLAGGMATRFHWDKPKGIFPIF